MKKYLFYSLLFSVFSLSFINPVSANEVKKDQEIVFQAEEINDQDELYERAIKGIQEVKLTDRELPKYELKNNNTKENVNLLQYTTSQLLKSEKKGDTEIQEFAVTTFTVTEEEVTNNDHLTTADSGSKDETKWDESLSVRASITIHYTRTIKNNVNYAKVTSASGSWTINDSSVSLSNRKVIIGTSGWPVNTQSVIKTPTGNSWNYTAPSTWEYVSLDAGHNVGADSTVTLKRGTSSSWTLTLSNKI